MNKRVKTPAMRPSGISRRRFVTGCALGGAAAGLGINPSRAWSGDPFPGHAPVLASSDIRLDIGHKAVNFTGRQRMATAINGSIPAPVLRWREGDEVRIAVRNHLAEDTSIHWHGIILPSSMDGVPHISDNFSGIAPGDTFHYRFKLNQSGTYWYHSHSGFQEQTGLYGAIIVDPVDEDPVAYDREHVIVVSDWSDEDPIDVYAKLKKKSHYYNTDKRTVSDLTEEIRAKGAVQTFDDRKMWNRMRMSDRDISDVTGYTYTFLMNGQTPADGWTGLFKKGEKVRLRIINAAAMTIFDLRIPGLKMTVVSADGQNVEPVTVEELRIGVAETYDVVVEPHADEAYTVFAQAIDRSGYARGTLTPDLSLTAEVPVLETMPSLSHTDMGMDHSMQHADTPMQGMNHADMSGHQHHSKKPMGNGAAGFGSNRNQPHADTEFGPHVDMRSEDAQYRLDDPGVGLRNNGRKVLTYSQLANLNPTPDPRDPTREIDLHLTGNMSRYMWSFNGIAYADAEPIVLKYNERVRVNLVNDTMMNHPIHLHGMWSDLETGQSSHIPRKHTVIVQPGAKVSYLVTADAMGRWAYHCHLMYHMASMFRVVEVVS